MIDFIVYGLGISGISVAKFLAKNFSDKKIILTDDNIDKLADKNLLDLFSSYKNIEIISPKLLTLKNLNSNTNIIFSPGIPLYFPVPHPILEIQKRSNAKLICDLDLFYQLNCNNNFIGITGTNGKSTTTALIEFVLKNLSVNCDMGGNIGLPCFENPVKSNHCYVFEASSFQLDLHLKMKYHIANLINITPDHLDRYGSFEDYINSKKRIFNNQDASSYSIINIDNQHTKKIYFELKNNHQFQAKIIPISTQVITDNSISLVNNILFNKLDHLDISFAINHQYLKGQHNQQNIAFAFASVYCLLAKSPQFNHLDRQQLSQLIINQILLFKGLNHRMQWVDKIDNINFINDSKATNAESTENALKSFDNIFWIVGGRAKEGGISILKPYLNKIIKAYLIGESSENFAIFFQENNINYEKCQNLENAFQKSYQDAKNSSIKEKNVLLSPACASLDQWNNFEQRGNFFCQLVKKIKQ